MLKLVLGAAFAIANAALLEAFNVPGWAGVLSGVLAGYAALLFATSPVWEKKKRIY